MDARGGSRSRRVRVGGEAALKPHAVSSDCDAPIKVFEIEVVLRWLLAWSLEVQRDETLGVRRPPFLLRRWRQIYPYFREVWYRSKADL